MRYGVTLHSKISPICTSGTSMYPTLVYIPYLCLPNTRTSSVPYVPSTSFWLHRFKIKIAWGIETCECNRQVWGQQWHRKLRQIKGLSRKSLRVKFFELHAENEPKFSPFPACISHKKSTIKWFNQNRRQHEKQWVSDIVQPSLSSLTFNKTRAYHSKHYST